MPINTRNDITKQRSHTNVRAPFPKSEESTETTKPQHSINDSDQQQQQWPMDDLITFDDSCSSADEEGTNNWFIRNDTALKEPRDLRKIVIGKARVGLDMVNALQASAAFKKKVDVTGKRRERKSVLPQHIWGQVEQELLEEGIQLVSREKGGAAEGRIRATLTYYGTSAVFYNHQVRTKIRMRIRYYLSYVRQADATLADVKREGATKDMGFLELKVKSPRAFEENSVDKYRLLVSDALIAQLINLNASEATFSNQLDVVKQAIQKDNTEQDSLIETIFGVLGKLAQQKPAFIRPSMVITYERSAYKYIEKDYPIPVQKATINSKMCMPAECNTSIKLSKTKLPQFSNLFQWCRRWGHTRTAPVHARHQEDTETETSSEAQHDDLEALHKTHHHIFYEPIREEPQPQKSGVEHHAIEYQFTIDRFVRAHYPLLPVKGAAQMPIAEHFDTSNCTELMRYPKDARVVEFKEPLVVAELPKKDRSDDHNTLIRVLVEHMESLIMWGDYDANVGKYGNLRSRLVQEHKTNRVKNELIEIDFSGKGEYSNNNSQLSNR